MSDVDLVIKIRDGAQIIADACAEYLEKMAPKEAEWDSSKIKWQQTEGDKGPYEKSDDFNNPEHKAMVKDLAVHGGKMTHEGFFFWLFQNGATVGRKKRRGKGKESAPTEEAARPDVEAIKSRFPSDLEALLTFEQEGDYVIIKPREYLGSETFAKIAAIVREAGGEYRSAGKASHFRVKRG